MFLIKLQEAHGLLADYRSEKPSKGYDTGPLTAPAQPRSPLTNADKDWDPHTSAFRETFSQMPSLQPYSNCSTFIGRL